MPPNVDDEPPPMPQGPPEPGGLYPLPAAAAASGEAAVLMRAVMRVSPMSFDYCWCTVCQQWYRYHGNLSTPWFENLVVHCKTKHFVSPDGTMMSLETEQGSAAASTLVSNPKSASPRAASSEQNIRVPKQPPKLAKSVEAAAAPSMGQPVTGGAKRELLVEPEQKSVVDGKGNSTNAKSRQATEPSTGWQVSLPQRAPQMKTVFPLHVRKIAERHQLLLFEKTRIVFMLAHFRMPAEGEDIEAVKKIEVKDVDTGANEHHLFYTSWATTQLFSSEMAVYGFKFVCANIRLTDKDSQPEPPPIEKWLLLEGLRHDPHVSKRILLPSTTGPALEPAQKANALAGVPRKPASVVIDLT